MVSRIADFFGGILFDCVGRITGQGGFLRSQGGCQ